MENIPSFSTTEGPLISIIVPVYNVAPYLERCLQSLARQTYTNIEVIIVDDCSTDDSYKIAIRMSEMDARFRAYQMPKNSGAGDTRQVAIQYSTGDLIGFLDGDDWMDKNFLSVLYGLMKMTSADIACCQHYFYSDNPRRLFTSWPYDDRVVELSPWEAMNKMRHYDQIDESLWNKLYRREVILPYIMKTSPFEDGLIIYRYFSSAKHIALCCIPIHYYYQREGSLMHTIYSPLKALVRYQMEIIKERAMAGSEVLNARLSKYHIQRGLKLLREYALLPDSDEIRHCSATIVSEIHSLDRGKKYLGVQSFFVYPLINNHLHVYLKIQKTFAKIFRKGKIEKINLKYSMDTMDVFKSGM